MHAVPTRNVEVKVLWTFITAIKIPAFRNIL